MMDVDRYGHRTDKVWRHIFETVILVGGSGVWLNFDDQWPDGSNNLIVALPIAGIVIIVAYLYSSCRRRAGSLWVEIPLQLCLLAGFVGMTLHTPGMSGDELWVHE